MPLNPLAQKRIDLLHALALQAAKTIRTVSAQDGIIQKEGRGNFVTQADLASEKIIMDGIKDAFPEDRILSEESQTDDSDLLASPHLWVIDPVDGTHNLRADRRYSAVSIGYAEHGIMQAGIISDIFNGDVFTAEKGKGAFLNGKRIAVNAGTDLHAASIASDNCYDPEGTRRNLELFLRIRPSPWFQMCGSAVLALCEVACGRTDLYYQTGLKPWDNAAGFLIMQEAGGTVLRFDGAEASFVDPEVAVGNAPLVRQFLRNIKEKA